MAIYINYGEDEEDAVVQGAEWLKNLLAEKSEDAEAEFAEAFKEGNVEGRGPNYDHIIDLFVSHCNDLFAYIPEGNPEKQVKEVESFFALSLSILVLLDKQDHLEEVTTKLCDNFTSQTTHSELRLRLLMMLYNTFNMGALELKYRIFKYILDYAAKANLFDQVLPYLEHLDAWMADWDKHLTAEDKRELYKDISRYMRALKKRVDAFLFLKKCHVLYQGESAKTIGDEVVVAETVQLLTDAIQLPSVIQFDDILKLDTVKALAKTKKVDLVNLCNIFLDGSVNDLRDFQKKNKKVFDDYDLSFDDCMSKIRLLTLATVAHGRNAEMTLGEVAEALEEKEENVEPWVVRAISEGVIDGRIDQLNSKVLVKSSFQRQFGKEQWHFLDTKLTGWIDNLENVIKFIGEQKSLQSEILK